MSQIATIPPARLRDAYATARHDLLAARNGAGHWVGELSSSALSTATAVSALALYRRHAADAHPIPRPTMDGLIDQATDWLVAEQNPDGGWGDTRRSYSNIATTMLVVAALELAERAETFRGAVARAEKYIESEGGLSGLRKRYGIDKTFAVPILTNYALAGRCDWREVASLPFELACIPQRFYHAVRLPVVSYAIPALVAVGQAGHFHRSRRNPYEWLRRFAVAPSMRVLSRMQPSSGGYLEAIPLTSFVVMSLAATGRSSHPVTHNGLRFLRDTVRADGSWPIDTNLSTWNSTLAINALGIQDDWQPHRLLTWLLDCQHRTRHPFTGAEPGGWGWSDLSGAVPDADDTPSALLALAHYRDWTALVPYDARQIRDAAELGVRWLLNLQNNDGGWPTFCKGWGKLPFDRSGTDLTAHAMRALQAWVSLVPPHQYSQALERGFGFLEQHQNADGSWTPLWFGNQDDPREENRVYGTSKVLAVYHAFRRGRSPAARRAADWLVKAQRPDGGWGTCGGRDRGVCAEVAGGIEESALALEALLRFDASERRESVVAKGLNWLVSAVESGRHRESSPIGLYFAKLWYDEKLYPLIFTASALRTATQMLDLAGAEIGGYRRSDSVSTRENDVRTVNAGKDEQPWIQHQCRPQSPRTNLDQMSL